MANNGALTTKQNKAISCLLSAKNNLEASKIAGVSNRTLTRWLTDPDFTRALKQAEGDLISNNIRELIKDLDVNRQTIMDIRDDPKTPEHVKLKACMALDSSVKSWRDLQNLETRITNLEEVVYDKHG